MKSRHPQSICHKSLKASIGKKLNTNAALFHTSKVIIIQDAARGILQNRWQALRAEDVNRAACHRIMVYTCAEKPTCKCYSICICSIRLPCR